MFVITQKKHWSHLCLQVMLEIQTFLKTTYVRSGYW